MARSAAAVAVAAAFLAAGAAPLLPAAQQPKTPNVVVVVFVDDLGQAGCSPRGGQDVPTPNMARLARAGVTFPRASVATRKNKE